MSNLENLTQKIIEDGEKEVDAIKEVSANNNEKILNSKIREANEKKDQILERANRDAKMSRERIISEAKLSARDQKLKAKRQVLDRVFNLAIENLKNINERDYISFLKSN